MSDKNLRSQVVLSSGDESAYLPDVPREVLKSLHRAIVGPTESLQRHDHIGLRIEIEDITNLVERLDQWARNFDLVSSQSRVIVKKMRRGKLDILGAESFSEIEAFRRLDESSKDPAVEVIVIYEIITQNIDQTLNTTNCNISMKNFVQFSAQQNADSIEFQYDQVIYGNSYHESPFVFSIQYSDYLLAKSLETIIENWRSELPKAPLRKPLRDLLSSFSRFDRSYRWQPTTSLEVLPLLASAFFTFLTFHPGIYYRIDISSHMYSLIIIFAGYYSIIYTSIEMIGRRIVRLGSPQQLIPLLKINRGNKELCSDYDQDIIDSERRQDQWRNGILIGLAVNIIFAFLLFLF